MLLLVILLVTEALWITLSRSLQIYACPALHCYICVCFVYKNTIFLQTEWVKTLTQCYKSKIISHFSATKFLAKRNVSSSLRHFCNTHTRKDTFVKQCHANCSISAIFPCKDDERKFSVSFFRHQCTMYTVYTVQYSIVHCALAPGILTWRWGRIRPKSCSVRQ